VIDSGASRNFRALQSGFVTYDLPTRCFLLPE
jgi:hypothetical protein